MSFISLNAMAGEFETAKLQMEVALLANDDEYFLKSINTLKKIEEEKIDHYLMNLNFKRSYSIGHLNMNRDMIIADFASRAERIKFYKKYNSILVENKYIILNTFFFNKEINEEPHTKFDVFDLKLWKFKKGKLVKDYNFYSYLSE